MTPFWESFKGSENLRWLNLAQNNLTKVPMEIQDLIHLEKLWLSGNPFDCNCEMTWMIDNTKTPSGEHVVVDFKDVECHNDLMEGKPIYKLQSVNMGCSDS